MSSTSSINIFQYLFVQRNAPEYVNELLANILDCSRNGIRRLGYSKFAIHHTNWIKHRTHVNKRDATAVFHIPKRH